MTVATHGIALALGWAVWAGGGFAPTPAAEDSPASTSPVRTRALDRATPARSSPEAEARELLAALRKSQDESVAASQEWNAPSADPQWFARIDSLKVPEDFQKAFDDLHAAILNKNAAMSPEDRAEAIAIGYHWLTHDPEGLFARLISGSVTDKFLGSIMLSLTPEIYRRDGMVELLPLLSRMGQYKSSAARSLAAAVAVKMDGPAVAAAKQSMDEQSWISFVRGVSANWPAANSAALVKLAAELNAPRLVLSVRNGENGPGIFLAGLLEDQSLPEEFRESLRQSGELLDVVRWDSSAPLDLRLRGTAPYSLIQHDVENVFARKRDWPFAFRRGEATADEVLTAVTAEMPELAAREPELLRKFVFAELAEENPAAAMSLLKDEPEAVRHEMALLASRTHFENIEPHKFLEMMEQIPSDDPEAWEGRLDAWNLRSFTNHGRLYEAYVGWVEKLPAGLDREMALYSLARAVPDIALAARLRAQVTDLELQKRIATHQ